MKGHSERVPRKNLRLLGDKPLFHHVVQNLLDSSYIKEVVINTDCAEITENALNSFQERVRLIERPKEICGDFVSMNTIIDYDMSQSEGEYFLQTHSTNPLLKTETIDQAIEEYFAKMGPEFDSLFGVTRFQSRFYDHEGTPINHNPNEMLRTQDLKPIYEENSNIYLFSRDSFSKNQTRIGSQPILFEIPHLESVDIDFEKDFQLAELIYQSNK